MTRSVVCIDRAEFHDGRLAELHRYLEYLILVLMAAYITLWHWEDNKHMHR